VTDTRQTDIESDLATEKCVAIGGVACARAIPPNSEKLTLTRRSWWCRSDRKVIREPSTSPAEDPNTLQHHHHQQQQQQQQQHDNMT